MGCPADAVPLGWRVWRGDVPPRLTDMAITIRDHIRLYPYGSIPAVVPWKAKDGTDILVGTWVCHHTWTYKGSTLIDNICIPGVTLVTTPGTPDQIADQPPDSIATPDPDAAMYPADTSIDWGTVAVTAVASLSVIGLFVLAVKAASAPKKRKRLAA